MHVSGSFIPCEPEWRADCAGSHRLSMRGVHSSCILLVCNRILMYFRMYADGRFRCRGLQTLSAPTCSQSLCAAATLNCKAGACHTTCKGKIAFFLSLFSTRRSNALL